MKELLSNVWMKLVLVIHDNRVKIVFASGFFVFRQSVVCPNICAFSYCISLPEERYALICNCNVTTLNFVETSDTFMLLITAFICCWLIKEMWEKLIPRGTDFLSHPCCGPWRKSSRRVVMDFQRWSSPSFLFKKRSTISKSFLTESVQCFFKII